MRCSVRTIVQYIELLCITKKRILNTDMLVSSLVHRLERCEKEVCSLLIASTPTFPV